MENNIIARRLAETGMSYEELARMVGVSKTTVVVWVKGTNAPNMKYGVRLADALGVTIEALVRGVNGSA